MTGIRQIDEGNIIHPTDANGLVDVTQIQPISLIFSLPQTDFLEIQQQMAKGPLKVLAYSQDDKTKLDEGKLDLVDNQIVQTTGTIRLRASFPKLNALSSGRASSSMHGCLLETRTMALTVAASAVQQGPKGSFVWVIGPDGDGADASRERCPDQRRTSADRSGLQADENVVVDGQYRLRRQPLVRNCMARPHRKPICRARSSRTIP